MTILAPCVFVAADAFVHLDGPIDDSKLDRVVNVALPASCEQPQIIATVVATDARFEIDHVRAQIHPPVPNLNFTFRFHAAPSTGKYVGSVVDCPDGDTEHQLQHALAVVKGSMQSTSRLLLRAFINVAYREMADDDPMRWISTLDQLRWCVEIDKLLAAPRDPGCSMFLLAAIVRAQLPVEDL